MREIQYGFVPLSAFCGRPRMFLPTSVKVAPPSRLNWRLPSSVPTQTTPVVTGDSEMDTIVPYEDTPSFFESCCVVPAAPINSTVHRSMCFVRSALAVHDSPLFTDLNNRLPPSQTVFGSCGERRSGVFQLKR